MTAPERHRTAIQYQRASFQLCLPQDHRKQHLYKLRCQLRMVRQMTRGWTLSETRPLLIQGKIERGANKVPVLWNMIWLGRAVVSVLHNSVLALVEVLPILRNTVPIQKQEGPSLRNIALILVKVVSVIKSWSDHVNLSSCCFQ